MFKIFEKLRRIKIVCPECGDTVSQLGFSPVNKCCLNCVAKRDGFKYAWARAIQGHWDSTPVPYKTFKDIVSSKGDENMSIKEEWRKVHSSIVFEFVETFGGRTVTPELFEECMKFFVERMGTDQKFELLLYLVSQVKHYTQ